MKEKRFAFPPLLFLLYPIAFYVLASFPAFNNPDFCFCGIVDGQGISAASVNYYVCAGYLGPSVSIPFWIGVAFLAAIGILGVCAAFIPKFRNGLWFGRFIAIGFAAVAVCFALSMLLAIPQIEKTSRDYYAIAYEPKGTTVDPVSAFSYANVLYYVLLIFPVLALAWWVWILFLSAKAKKAAA